MNNEKLSSQEKLLLSTQMIQYASGILSNLIRDFNDLNDNGGHEHDRLDEMIALHNEVSNQVYVTLERLLNYLDSTDALVEIDLNIINPILTAIQCSHDNIR